MAFFLVSWLIVQDAQGRVLLGRRAGTSYGAGLWGLPGGKVERGEALAAAAAREAQEETGLTVRPGDLTSLGVCRYDLGGVQGADYFFLVRIWQGTPAPLENTSETGWFALNNLPPDILPWLPGVLEAHLQRGVRISEQLDGWDGLRELPGA